MKAIYKLSISRYNDRNSEWHLYFDCIPTKAQALKALRSEINANKQEFKDLNLPMPKDLLKELDEFIRVLKRLGIPKYTLRSGRATVTNGKIHVSIMLLFLHQKGETYVSNYKELRETTQVSAD
jgi:hypothetical protein